MKKPCNRCGAPILETTHANHRGLCLPCFRQGEALWSLPARFVRDVISFPSDLLWVLRDTLRAPAACPSDISEAVNLLFQTVGPEHPRKFPTADAFATAEHFGLGLGIRNNWGLWRPNSKLLAACGTQEADVASSLILEEFWHRATRL